MNKVNFVLCDDNPDDLEALRRSTNDYICRRGCLGKTVCFSSPEEVLRFSESSDACTVYLLDVIMPETDGIELGKRLREHSGGAEIIYISTSREYALDAYSVHAFSYLIKPFSSERLFEELDGCLKRMEKALLKVSITVKTADGTAVLRLSDIIAVEYLGHRLAFHMYDGKRIESVYRKQPFDVQAEELIATGVFLKISMSYLINYRNIRGIKSDEFIMRDGSQYKITRKYADARKKYIDYELNGGVPYDDL